MHDIIVRKMPFEFPEDIDVVFIDGEPEESFQNAALSLLLPYLEPYLIRSMRAARKQITDEALREGLDRFVAQEGQHYRQHRRFNEIFRGRGFDRMEAMEQRVEADYQRWTKTKSLRFNLAYAEGFEAMTTQLAHVAAEQDMSHWHPSVRDLFMWHLVEELEHRTVAFDVYDHVCGGYGYRLVVGMFAQWHLVRFIDRVSRYMLNADPARTAAYGGRIGRMRRTWRLLGIFVRDVMPRVLRTYTPWYTPHAVLVPERMKALAARYNDMATSKR